MTRINIKRVKPKKIPKKSTLINKADDLWRDIVKKDKFCEWCGAGNCVLNAHHIMGKSRQSLKWDLRNGVCLCYSCHIPNGAHSQSEAKVEKYINWIKSYRPEDWRYLKEKLKQPSETITSLKLMDIVEYLQEMLKLKNG